jgi:hypothetical protein
MTSNGSLAMTLNGPGFSNYQWYLAPQFLQPLAGIASDKRSLLEAITTLTH